MAWAAAVPAGAETLHLRLTGEPATLDWNLATSSHETYLIMNLMQGLVEEGEDLKPRAALAEKWDISPDGLTYVFELRAGVKWSDGRALLASDFVDSWRRLLDPKTRSPYASFLFDVENAEHYHLGKLKDVAQVGVRALDARRLQVKLRRRTPEFLHLPTFWVTFPIRLDLVAKHGKAWTRPGKIATVGPYLMSEWKKGRIVLKKNPAAGLPKETVDVVEAIVEPSDAAARQLFSHGKIDFFLEATTADLVRGLGKAAQYPYLATYYLGFNTRASALGDPEVRKALASAADRGSIPAELQGGQQVASSFIPPGMGYTPPSYEPESLYEARGAMAKAGFGEGKGFPKLSFWVEKFDGADRLAALIARNLAEKLGVTAEPRIGTPAEYQRALAQGKADLFVRHWGADYPDPANFLEVFASHSGNNATGWRSAEYDGFIAQARDAVAPQDRISAFLRAEQLLIQKEAVIAPLFHRKNTVLLGPRVKELKITPLNYLFLKDVRVGAP
jgi:oligopeptide transport system substrate-binding protein